jgi:O-succinylbenzoic acid--CoA ligase
MRNPFAIDDASRLQAWLDESGSCSEVGHVFFQTSGSTGKAKWVALSRSALLASARAVNSHLGVRIGAKWALCLPIYHVGGFGVLARAFLSGGICQVFHGKWEPLRFTRFLYTEGSEYTSLVPTQVVDLVRKRCVAPQSLEAVVVGGGKLDDSLYEQARTLGWPLFRSYGMTEACSQIATGENPEGLEVLSCWQTRVDSNGLLEWKGEVAMSFYLYQQDDGTFLKEDPKRDGWFKTQDRVELTGGRLKMLGRADSLVKILGELVDLTTIEEKIRQATGVDCVVLDIPDERRGLALVAVIESNNVASLPKFSGVERLQKVHYLDAFPRSGLGKVKRAEVRKIVKSL